MSSDCKYLVRKTDKQRAQLVNVQHPLNERSQVTLRGIGRAAGLVRTGVTYAVLPPSRESFIYHSHKREEEWVFIISGSGTAIIDGDEFPVSAGDFMGFPTPSVAHTLINSSEDDLIYLMGGESKHFEIGEFPNLGKLLIRDGREAFMVDKGSFVEFPPKSEELDP